MKNRIIWITGISGSEKQLWLIKSEKIKIYKN